VSSALPGMDPEPGIPRRAGVVTPKPAGRRTPAPRPPAPVSMLSLLRNVEFRALAITQFLSIAGDQLARVALSVLVFNRTNSALQTAAAYALTFLPAAVGGPLLAGLADRRPRRTVMITSDLLRAPLIGLIAIPTLPLWAAMILLSVAGLFEAPFEAARGALLPDVLLGDRLTAGYAFRQITFQAAQVGGFGIAGILLLALSPSTLLVIDAATFVFSAILLARVVTHRPAAHIEDSPRDAWWTHAVSDMKASVGIVLLSPRVRPLALLAWSATVFAIGFEALGAPLARDSGSASWTVGMLLASQPVGTVFGAIFATRVRPAARERTMRLLALLAMVPLGFGLLTPPLPLLVTIGVISGFGMSFNVLASTAFINRVARPLRGRALGLVSTGLLVGQGIGVLLAGAIATALDARIALGWLGVAGTIAVIVALWDGSRTRHTQ
jgi:MFS family permease